MAESKMNSPEEVDEISDDEKCQVSIEIDPDGNFVDNEMTTTFLCAPEPPEIPSFLENVRVEQITPEIQRRLSLILDLPSPTQALKNWEWLASLLGMPAEEITYLRERALYPESPTREVLRRYGRESFGRLLRLVRDSLQRYDVIIQLLPALTAFEEYLRSGKPEEAAAGASAAAAASAVPECKFPVSSTLDSGVVGSAQATSYGITGSISRPIDNSRNGRPLVLVTFADESPQHRKLILWLCKNLENANARVILDDCLASTASDDWSGRVSECFSKAVAIIVVCSPAYFRCVDAPSPEGPALDSHGQCSRLIYQLMCAEYRQLNCRNRRFRPIVFDPTPGAEVVPPILRNTVIHRWPAQHNELMRFIFGDNH